MLQFIRERMTGVFALFIILLIGVPLVISFGNMDAGVASGNFAAIVNDEEIPLSEFRQSYQNQLFSQQERLQGEIPEALAEQVKVNVLESMIRARVLSQHVQKQGYRVSDERLVGHIRGLPVFQVGGEFSVKSYIATLASQGLSREGFENDMRRDMEINQFRDGIIASSFFTPTEFRRFIELEQERREAVFVQFDPAALAAETSIGDEDVLAFYEANANSFQTDESVSLEFVELTLADVSGDVEVTEADLRAWYENTLDRFQSQEERKVRHILIAVDADTDQAAAEAMAVELRSRLDKGEDFGALAQEYSDDPGSAEIGGDLGWAGSGVYVKPFEDAVFSLGDDEISQPLSTQFGYHIIQLQGVRKGSQQSFEEVRDQLTDELKNQVGEDRFFALAERMDELALENPGSLNAVADGAGLQVKRAGEITRAGGAPFGFNRALVDAAFSPEILEDGENSSLIEITKDRAVIIRVTDHRLPEFRPLEEVRDQIVNALQFDASSSLARERGEAMLARLEAGEEFAELVKEFGVELMDPGPLNRTSDGVSADLLAAIFRAPRVNQEKSVSQGLALSDGSYVVFRLDNSTMGQPTDIPRQDRDQLKGIMARQTGVGSLAATVGDLRVAADLSIAPDLLKVEDDQEF
jgi:peptidyl-prolyl cis-trans isomerase D